MKKKFSTKWKGSSQKRKKVKYRANAPLHIRHRFMAGNLSEELRKKYGKRSFPLRKGDVVKVMRGKFKKKTGKVNTVDLKRLRVSIEGLQRQKKDGTKINVYFDASKLQIQELTLDDSERMKLLMKEEKNKAEEKQGEKNVPKKK